MEPVTQDTLTRFLTRLGEQYPNPVNLYLLGGSALLLLGNLRQTLDVDFMTDLNSQQQRSLEIIMNELAAEYRLDIEEVPISEFVPLPPGAEARRRFIGRFGQIEVYLYDLYTIALSKIARGFDTDMDDVIFLVKANHIDLAELKNTFSRSCHEQPKQISFPANSNNIFKICCAG